MQSYYSNRGETERTKSRAQHSSSSGGSVHNIRDASESTVFPQRTRVRVLGGWWRAQPTDGQEAALQHHAASAVINVCQRKTHVTPTPTSRGRRSGNAPHQAATSVRRWQPQRRRWVVIVLVGWYGTTQCQRRRRNHENSNVFSCRRITAMTGCRPATAPGTAQCPPARTRAQDNEELRNVPSRTMSGGHL